MPIDSIDSIPFDELENVKKNNSCINEDEELAMVIEDERKAPGFCRTLFVVLMVLVMGWFLGTVLITFLGVAYQADPVSVYVDQIDLKFGTKQIVAAEMVPEELQVFVVNMTAGAEIPETVTTSFYSCMHAFSPSVVGCVSQFYVPSFEECVALSAQENEGNDLSQPRAISTCGAATISRGEFSLCSLAHPVYLSVWNLEDTHRTVELSFGYDECEACYEVEGNCYIAGYYWESIFLMYTLALFVCCCCVGCVCGCAGSSNTDDDDDDIEQDL
uniref:Uncharacterized protein n=1 Tax=Vannella robusta TaxID=1487602 RepID=A0A6U1SVJ2_9EUKA|eukprot:CAMPEP_0206193252 /NCGR_PEP_ID=MMETSP0166-20121206/6452_1 /ASSEMBLY_ACC=CAM_ASM_000260 /TAXON_ID=95228 /ORGANISM="Vannella robusta, Strain DIVA3 518/3/11/1/6" /LENGTH=272 /DNA_ID=CAMNT_0053609921 /DNA_START=32 /DNA_END=850 /DNA_ORIENTATION=-